MAWVSSGRWLDAGVMALLLVMFSGLCLSTMSTFHRMLYNNDFSQYKFVPEFLKICMPYKKFDVSVNQAILFGILVALLSLRPDYELKEYLDDCNGKKKDD